MGAHEEGRGHHARVDAPRCVRIPMVPGTNLRGRAASHARRDLSRERRKPSVDHGCARLARSLTILSFTWFLIWPFRPTVGSWRPKIEDGADSTDSGSSDPIHDRRREADFSIGSP